MDAPLDKIVSGLCVEAVNACIQARNESRYLGLHGVSFTKEQLGVVRLTKGRVKKILTTMANYGIKDARYYEWGEFKGALKLADAVISPDNIPLTSSSVSCVK